jgi:hypothetical protein
MVQAFSSQVLDFGYQSRVSEKACLENGTLV